MNFKSATSFLLRTCVRGVLLFIFMGLPAIFYYLSQVGVGDPWTQEISKALSSPNFTVRVKKLTLNPFEGISAHDLEVFNPQGMRLANVSAVLIGLNLSELVQQRVQVESVELIRADLSIPTSGGDPVEVFNVQGHLLISPTQVHLTQFDFKLAGIQFSVIGTMYREGTLATHPWSNPPASKQAGGGSGSGEMVERVRRVLKECSFGNSTPQVNIELGGSGSSPDDIQAPSIRVEIPEIRWKGLQLNQVRLEAAYSAKVLTVKSLSAVDARGQLNAAVTVDFEQKKLRLDALSSIDVSPLLPSFADQEWAKDVVLNAPPHASFELNFDFQNPVPVWQMNGSLNLENFRVKGVSFDLVNGDFTYRMGKFLTRGLTVRAPNMDMRFDLMADAETLRFRTSGTVDPLPLQPLLGPGLGVIFGQMQFDERGKVTFEGEMPIKNSGAITGTGHLILGKTAMRGAWLDSGQADIEIKDRAVFYRNIEVRRGKGVGTGDFIYDFGGKQVRLENIKSTLNPQEIMLWVDQGIAKTVAEYRFKANPQVTADGVVDMAKPERNDLNITVKAKAGLDYDLLGKTLPFGSTEGVVKLKGQVIQADIKSAQLFGGTLALVADVPVNPEGSKIYSVALTTTHVNFSDLTKLYFDYDNSQGWMSGKFRFKAPLTDSRSLNGKGSIRIEEGNVFAIPILGPFSGIINGILSGAGYQNARKATADFSIADQKINTKNLEIQGQGFSMFGEGDIYFVTDRLDMSMRINAQGVPGIVLFPVSKLFEYVSLGTISDPVWRPKNVVRLFGDSDPKAADPTRRETPVKPGGR